LYKKGKTLSKQTHKKKLRRKTMKPKKLFPRPNIITPALQLGLTDVSENKPTKNKTKKNGKL
jgi:hypothetical protein